MIDGTSQTGLFRLNPDGSRDLTLPPVRLDGARDEGSILVNPGGLALQPDGKILLIGNFNSVDEVPRAGVVRLLGHSGGPPVISLLSPQGRVAGPGRISVTVQRSGDTSLPTSIEFSTEDGSAVAHRDYVPASGVVELAPLEVEKELIISVLEDGFPGLDRAFSVQLSNPYPDRNRSARRSRHCSCQIRSGQGAWIQRSVPN